MPLEKKGSSVVADINVTPMVDVMLVLLIIFMVITPMIQTRIPVELAKAHNPHSMQDADREDAVVVAIKHDGSVYLGIEKMTTASELAPKVRDLLAARAEKTVYIKSDARAKYKNVVEVVDNIRSAGIDNLGLLTDKIQEKAVQSHERGPLWR